MVFAVFAGSWSDVHGRKTLIVLSCFGYVFNNLTYMLNAHFWYELKAEYLLFECLQDCTGGYVCFFLGCYSYISDISDKRTHTRRLAFLDGIFPVGFLAGMALSGFVKSSLGYLGNFGIAMGCAIAAMLWAMLFLKDSRTMRPTEVLQERINIEEEEVIAEGKGCSKSFFLATMFDIRNIKRAFRVTFKRRAYNVRPYLLILASVFVLEIFMTNGRGPTSYLYYREAQHF